MRFALSNLVDGEEPGYRTISRSEDAAPEEVVTDSPPEGEVWDAVSQRLRPKTADEMLDEAKQAKIAEIRGHVVAEASAVMPVWEFIYITRANISDPRTTTLKNIAEKGRDLEGQAGAATTIEEVEAIQW